MAIDQIPGDRLQLLVTNWKDLGGPLKIHKAHASVPPALEPAKKERRGLDRYLQYLTCLGRYLMT
jgi:hypothetical protein